MKLFELFVLERPGLAVAFVAWMCWIVLLPATVALVVAHKRSFFTRVVGYMLAQAALAAPVWSFFAMPDWPAMHGETIIELLSFILVMGAPVGVTLVYGLRRATVAS